MNAVNGLKEQFYEFWEWLEKSGCWTQNLTISYKVIAICLQCSAAQNEEKKKKKGFLNFSQLLIFSHLWEVMGSSTHKIPCKNTTESTNIWLRVAKYSLLLTHQFRVNWEDFYEIVKLVFISVLKMATNHSI